MHPELHSPRAFARKRAGERGEALVEFALALTVFLMTVFGTMELGIGIFRYNMLSDLAQEGARWAAVRGARTTDPATTANLNTFLTGRALGIPLTSVTM